MYPKFIEVHARKQDLSEDIVTFVNVAQIVYFHNNRICTTDGVYLVSETFEELKEMIKDCGCLIHKRDPRLNMDHPLTLEDLKTMVGEPVWNSNTGKWALVRNYIEVPEPDGIDVAFLLDAADNSTGMTAGDLIKTPLYRMNERGSGD